MLYVFLLLFICGFLGVLYTSSTKRPLLARDGILNSCELRESNSAKVLLLIICIILVLFSGLRTSFNDTAHYANAFNNTVYGSLSGLMRINWTIGANPLFEAYQIIIKSLISRNSQSFLFISALVTNVSFLMYLKKYSCNFGISLFVFIGFATYAFSMLAIKQSLATAIAIWSIPPCLEKRYAKVIMLLVVAMLVHPYVVLFAATPFLHDTTWDKKTAALILAVIIAGFAFDRLASGLLGASSQAFGDNYSESVFARGTGTTLYRVVVYALTPLISFRYRHQINAYHNAFLNICINYTIVATGLVYLGLFGGALVFGRLANYFDILTCLAIPFILYYGEDNKVVRRRLIIAIVIVVTVYYYFYFKKYIGLWFSNPFNHISLSDLLVGW